MAGLHPETIAALIGDIYESAYDARGWPSLVEALRVFFNGSKACLIRQGPDLGEDDAVTTASDPSFQPLYLEHFAYDHPLLRMAMAAPVGVVYGDRAGLDRDAFAKTAFFNEWMAPQDMHDGLTCKLMQVNGSAWFFDVQRGRTHPRFDEEDRALLQNLAPYLSRALAIGRSQQLTKAAEHAQSLLNPTGMAVVDLHLRLVWMNAAAQALLSRPGMALHERGGQLYAHAARESATLRRMVALAAHPPGATGNILIHSESSENGDGGLAVTVAPMSRPASAAPRIEPCASIFIRPLGPRVEGLAETARALFGLSPKEAELASALASGATLKEAAAHRTIAVKTARSYLESIFRKTQTRQQSQLVALLKSVQP